MRNVFFIMDVGAQAINIYIGMMTVRIIYMSGNGAGSTSYLDRDIVCIK